MDILDKNVGGAYVRRTFTNGGRQMKAGDVLSAEEFLGFPKANRRALTEAGYLAVYPKAPDGVVGERFVIRLNKDEYNVIEGRKVNDKSLSREQAEELADS